MSYMESHSKFHGSSHHQAAMIRPSLVAQDEEKASNVFGMNTNRSTRDVHQGPANS